MKRSASGIRFANPEPGTGSTSEEGTRAPFAITSRAADTMTRMAKNPLREAPRSIWPAPGRRNVVAVSRKVLRFAARLPRPVRRSRVNSMDLRSFTAPKHSSQNARCCCRNTQRRQTTFWQFEHCSVASARPIICPSPAKQRKRATRKKSEKGGGGASRVRNESQRLLWTAERPRSGAVRRARSQRASISGIASITVRFS